MAQPTNDLLSLWLKAKDGLPGPEARLIVECLTDVYDLINRGEHGAREARNRIAALLWNR
jgi:hypothetical protein